MKIKQFSVAGYRSIRELNVPMNAANIIVGANGTGKTNLYRALHLLHAAADGRLARTIGEEGGMASVLWAGRRRKGPVRVRLAVELETLAYELTFGLPQPDITSKFKLDPLVKTERAWLLAGKSRICILDRDNTTATARDGDGNKVLFPHGLSPSESAIAELREPARFPELSALRQEFLGWRFYHQFRTDVGSRLRQPQVGVRTPTLAHDGSDLISALQTIREIGDHQVLTATIANAFPGNELLIDADGQRFLLALSMPGINRPVTQQELSDGTLHYLCLVAAMLSPRPPPLLAVNEPEGSLHSGLYPALAELIVRASESSQVWMTTHAEPLSRLVEDRVNTKPLRLDKVQGETRIVGHGILGPLDEDDAE